jgi:hypothetical protein
MGRDRVDCGVKTPLVELDELVFKFFYTHIRASSNQVLLTICAFPYLVHFGSPGFYLLYLLIKRPGWYYFWLYGLSLGFTSSFSIILQYCFRQHHPGNSDIYLLRQNFTKSIKYYLQRYLVAYMDSTNLYAERFRPFMSSGPP